MLVAMDLLLTASWPLRLALVAALLFGMTAVFTGLAALLERLLAAYRIFAVPLRPGQRRRELRNCLVFQALAALALTGFLGAELVPWTDGWGPGLRTFFACWVGFEVYYYLLHRAMHLRGLIRFHREHHESHVNTPLTAFSMSIPEGLGWLVGYTFVPATMALLGLEVSLGGWLAYLVYNYWGNIVGHVNVEVVPAMIGKRANSWAAHAITYHALHHARYTGHYGFGATFMDRLCGSEWRDWPTLHAQILAGQPLTSLKQRG